jgi:peptidylprolyl isomerase
MATDPENTLIIELSTGGPVVIEMYPEKAPNHVARFQEQARAGFYEGLVFHRVMDGFMAQGGDPTGTGMGKSDLPNLQAEFNDIEHVRGVVSMARSGDPDSANSQFFIVLADSLFLDGQYTAWGMVTEGMEHVDKLTKGAPGSGAVPKDKQGNIVSMKVAADE